MKFSEKLQKLRKEKGLSQEDLANKLNVTRQTVSKWELEETVPDMNKLIEIAKLFDISLDELVNGVNESSTKNNNNNNNKNDKGGVFMSKDKKLYRVEEGKIFAGICTGLAEYANMDVTIVRVLWVLITLLGGCGLILYIVCIFIIPIKPVEIKKETKKEIIEEKK